jgi:hypothetical protein
MAHLHESGGQHMLQKAPDELEDIESGFSGPATPLFPVGKGDRGFVKGNDSGVGNSDSGLFILVGSGNLYPGMSFLGLMCLLFIFSLTAWHDRELFLVGPFSAGTSAPIPEE